MRGGLVRLGAVLLVLCAAPAAHAATTAPLLHVKRVRFSYVTHDGKTSYAIVLLPGWYGPKRHPALPLIICPHGRNTFPDSTAKRWRDLPTRGGFAVVLPAGQGRVWQFESWGYPGQIDDLARMPQLVERAIPSFHYLRNRVYGIGDSMGGQEILLLLAKHPHLLAGAIAFDPAVDMAERYYAFPSLKFGHRLQRRARIEMGGTPDQVPQAYAERSPINDARQIAFSGVPLELWWSIDDRIITDQSRQAGRLYQEIKLANPAAPVSPYVGRWHHTAEGFADTQLPGALARLGLLSPRWEFDDPLHFHRAHLATTQEVNSLVSTADARVSKRLTNADTLVAGWWRTAFIAVAAVLVLVAVAFGTFVWRGGRMPLTNEGR